MPVDEFSRKVKSSAYEDSSLPKTIVINGDLIVKDIRNVHGNVSLLNIYENGLRLNESVIDSEFEFSNVEVNDLITEKINNISVDSWVYNVDSEEPVIIEGGKIFKKNVEISEKAYVHVVDGVDVEELEEDTFKLNGDQNITGTLTVESIKCDK